jgi:hypothetical protein
MCGSSYQTELSDAIGKFLPSSFFPIGGSEVERGGRRNGWLGWLQ